MKKGIIYLVLLIALIGLGVYVVGMMQTDRDGERGQAATSTEPVSKSALPDSDYKTVDIVAPAGILHIMIADTDAKMELGLSNRHSISPQSGMIFAFAEAGKYSFWMKDMLFPLDIVWVDEAKKVVGVAKNVLPESYPETVNPPREILYAIEIPSGASDEFGIATGTVLEF